MRIYQLKNGYRYNSDTLFLWNFISNFNPKGNLLDVGCGCGILGLLFKRDFPNLSVTMLDFQEINCEISAKNCSQNAQDCDIICSDFLEFGSNLRFDFIVSNPPFYHDGVQKSENRHINLSRYAENLKFRDFVNHANSIIMPKGNLAFCYESAEISEVLSVLKEFKFGVKFIQFVRSKAQKNAKLMLVFAQKNSKSKCEILPDIVAYEGENYSQNAREIFKKADLESVDYEV